MKTLLLNASYEPLTVVSWKRAIALVLADKAEVIHDSDQVVHSTSTDEIGKPSIIRLKHFVQVPYRREMRPTGRAILARDKHICQFTHCNNKATTVDHVVPRSKGGSNEWTNVVAACKRCNFKKADKSMKKLGWKLKRQPKAPPTGRYLLIGMAPDEAWEQYLAPIG